MKNKEIISFLSFILLFISCASDRIEPNKEIIVSPEKIIATQNAGEYDINVNIQDNWSVSLPEADCIWCKIVTTSTGFQVQLTENVNLEMRSTEITVKGPVNKQLILVEQLGQKPDILVAFEQYNLGHQDSVFSIKTVSNIEYDFILPDTIVWLKEILPTKSMTEREHWIQSLKNETDIKRFTTVVLKGKDYSVEKSIMIIQNFRDKSYNPITPEGIGDERINVRSGNASTFQYGEEIEKSFDGDISTHYHSSWNETRFPVTLEYYFDGLQSVDYIVYKPRTQGGENGLFGKFDLAFQYEESDSFVEYKSFDFGEQISLSSIQIEPSDKQIRGVRFTVHSGKNGFVSCGEMEFYKKGNEWPQLTEVFTDKLCCELLPGITQTHIDKIENAFFRTIAQSLADKTYEQFRIQKHESFPLINTTAKKLKISGYCPFENPTGIWFTKGEEAVILIDNPTNTPIYLDTRDWDTDKSGSYLLKDGVNKLLIQESGLGYINYFTDENSAQDIRVHIPSGEINGVFDKKINTDADWASILNNAVCRYLDMKGEYINLAYTTTGLKQYCKSPVGLLNIYDRITVLEHEIMGLIKYNKQPKNHMFARIVKSGLFADGWGAGFAEDCMNELASEQKAGKEGVWCIAHELGHVNQIRPGLKWVSTTEVTNNIYSVCARFEMYPEYLNLEQERCNDGDNNYTLGGRFNSYLNYGVVKGEQWLCQRGQDKMEGYEEGGDHFVKLCPLWQLLLYYRYGGCGNLNRKDWYGDVSEIVRNTSDFNLSNGDLQLGFIRNVCDVIGEDLTDFFVKVGMLKPIDKYMDDYSKGQLTITQQQCDDLIQYASKYPKPISPVIYYLTANSLDVFKNKAAVTGNYQQGIIFKQSSCIINHNEWKNVVVFETYKHDQLIKVAMVGTDSPNKSTTLVFYPEGSTRIEAVAYDGKRTLVYGKR